MCALGASIHLAACVRLPHVSSPRRSWGRASEQAQPVEMRTLSRCIGANVRNCNARTAVLAGGRGAGDQRECVEGWLVPPGLGEQGGGARRPGRTTTASTLWTPPSDPRILCASPRWCAPEPLLFAAFSSQPEWQSVAQSTPPLAHQRLTRLRRAKYGNPKESCVYPECKPRHPRDNNPRNYNSWPAARGAGCSVMLARQLMSRCLEVAVAGVALQQLRGAGRRTSVSIQRRRTLHEVHILKFWEP